MTSMPTLDSQPATISAEPRRTARALRVALAGGGTGGHIVPGLHLFAWQPSADADPADVVWFTSGRAVEDRVLGGARDLLARTPFERVALPIEPPGGGAPSRARLVVRTPAAGVRARERLVAHRSQVLLGLGGFTSLPAVVAARSLGIPVVLLEINAHSGAATRWLSRFATRVLHAWRATLPHGEDRVNRFVGPPLSPVFHAQAGLDEPARQGLSKRARERLGFDPRQPLLVVLGGSQGSSALNAFVRAHAAAFTEAGLQVLHQTGPHKLHEAADPARGYCAVEYVDPAHEALSAATVALVRGGASTLAEVAALRVPAFVAPYPGHADAHQERNARELGAGVRIVPDAELGPRVRDALLHLASPGGAPGRAAMRDALARALPTDAAVRIWEHLSQVAAEREAALRTTARGRIPETNSA